MDVVYVLGKGSKWQDNELRYSLRSIQMFLKGFRNVYVVGECPPWLQNIIHIPFAHARSYVFKEQNIYEKILQACNHADVSDDFIFFNDDHFLVSNLQASTLPYYQKGDLKNVREGRTEEDAYWLSCRNTIEVLTHLDLPTTNFDIHSPIIYNKALFSLALAPLHWSRHYGYVIKSMYCNLLGIKGEHMKDCKINFPAKIFDISAAIRNRPFFSCGDRGLQGDLKTYLQQLYPQKSIYEK